MGPFKQNLRCHSVAVLERNELECGGKIILPPSALDHLTKLHINYPMLFCIKNTQRNMQTHSGVLEFIAEEGLCYMPYWMMDRLLIQEGDFVEITSATLQKGQFVKLQPHTTSFIDISNPRAVLEMAFRAYSTLTVGDTIKVEYNSKIYLIDVLEVQPANVNNAITIVEADVQVDFAPPLDYVEPVPSFAAPATQNQIPAENLDNTAAAELQEDPKSLRFTGEYHTLRGGPPKQFRSDLTKSAPVNGQPITVPNSSAAASPGEVVFKTRDLKRSNSLLSSGERKSKRRKRGELNVPEPEPEKPKLVPFSGVGHSLR
eukprot:CAMPEP_0117029798 /NCGR_PEP_ID=MMETSP0472-20121206/21539_1 /TAXON_ID=693140 ORGANISM="Tiarina fusus, Strain LIS" /NCGR_SAMPLE_ID=MMETSP0472 /ASSEMBLY_ACC=CAM_ASM_000603 /LENGTH=315 /DNA_ID=CAMNT_0004737649 /DNA_START=97 /DNA_END=1044 /DNA_ORIENTATION=-